MAVDLGFIDKSAELLDSRFFPSKVGGKPAWLDLKDIPATEELICSRCRSPYRFLCQLYSPVDEKESAFHRTVFVFLCTSKECFLPNSNRNFIVLRSQLPRCNSYYPSTPPVENRNWRPDLTCSKFGIHLCHICGIRAELRCNRKCVKQFCSNDHEQFHDCGPQPEVCSRVPLLPEYGLGIEPEDLSDSESCSEDSESDSETAEDHALETESNYSSFAKLASAQDDPAVEQIFSECSEKIQDKAFANFKSRVAMKPEQVIRYGKNTQPLWLSDEHIPSHDSIPVCDYCGDDREFEFQVLPQLLNHLNLDQENDYAAGLLDWGTLAIYTCRSSCDQGSAYKKEYLWKQDLLT